MNPNFLFRAIGFSAFFLAVTLCSCTVDQTVSQDAGHAGAAAREKSDASLAERRKEARERQLAAQEKREEMKRELAMREARRKQERIAAVKRKRAELLAEQEKAYLARRRLVEERAALVADREVPALAERGGVGFFSRMAVVTPAKYKSKGHGVKVDHRLLSGLEPSNAKIEIDLSEQKARVYKVAGGHRHLVIETRVSTGKPGYSTPTGSFRISEKQVAKRSTLYGTWLDSSGQMVRSSGQAGNRPPGATTFVGAEMPYWMRINGGIGLHIGEVPSGPASHGCIRVPGAVQPLIYSKVGVGTKVSVIN